MTNPLTQPVGVLAAHVEPVFPEDSIFSVTRELVVQGLPAMPVVSDYQLVGALSEATIQRVFSEGHEHETAVREVMDTHPPTIAVGESGSEALRRFSDEGCLWLIVVDARNEPIGVLTPSRLVAQVGSREYKGRIGGMATPFGVYLTNGVVSGGASPWALVATGALMSGLFHVAGFAVVAIQNSLPQRFQYTGLTLNIMQFAWMALFFLGLRLVPLSGTHGAEHMVVHAIERGEPLIPSVVSRMPRVHPRCGTNLAVGAMLFLTIMSIDFVVDMELRLLLAVLVTVLLWQPLGSLLQYFVTTKKPNAKQLEDGIRAGQQFLDVAARAPFSRVTIASRLLKSGLFQVLLGGTAVALLVYLAYVVLRVPHQWRVS